MTALLVVLILVVLIVVHEFGHFLAAKLFGVQVREFGIGYPPRAVLFGKIAGTEYTLNWILFGGFVRLFGEEGGSERGRGSFSSASRGKQACILASGVIMNVFLAWMLFAGALHLGIPRAVDAPAAAAGNGVHLFIAEVVPGSPAEAAGVRAGDELLGITDAGGAQPSALSPQAVSLFLGDHGGKRISITYVRNKATSTAVAVPANAVIPGAAGRPALGVGLVLVSSQAVPWTSALVEGFLQVVDSFSRVAQNVWMMISEALRGSLDLSAVVGPVGLVSVVGAAAKTGVAQVMALAAFISVNLAVINLLPIPLLDGGRLLIVVAEAVSRRPISKIVVHALNVIGVALIGVLMIVVTYHDIARLVA